MKRVCLLVSLLLGSVYLCEPAFAYVPGPDIIRECPKCHQHLKQNTTMSGNTFGAHFWTDEKMLAPMLPDRPWLVKCPKCKELFWIDEAEELGKQPWDKNRKWPNALLPNTPSETDFLTILSAAKLSQKKELYLRQRAWWAANDAFRYNTCQKPVRDLPDRQKENLRTLFQLLDKRHDDQRIMKAEIAR